MLTVDIENKVRFISVMLSLIAEFEYFSYYRNYFRNSSSMSLGLSRYGSMVFSTAPSSEFFME